MTAIDLQLLAQRVILALGLYVLAVVAIVAALYLIARGLARLSGRMTYRDRKALLHTRVQMLHDGQIGAQDPDPTGR